MTSAGAPGALSAGLRPLKRVLQENRSAGSACLFLDRDGVINRRIEGGYVTDWREFSFLPGAIDAMKAVSHRIPVVIVSNQRCIGRGIATAVQVSEIMDRMVDELETCGVHIAAWYVCPHDYCDGCQCRKPLPGMFLEAAVDLPCDLSASVMIGDSGSDVEAGYAAGCAYSAQYDAARDDLLSLLQSAIGAC